MINALKFKLNTAVYHKTIQRGVNIFEYRVCNIAGIYRAEFRLPDIGQVLQVDQQRKPLLYFFCH
jgi:hypothetical protein